MAQRHPNHQPYGPGQKRIPKSGKIVKQRPGQKSSKGICEMWVPVAVAMMPYALFRYWLDSRSSK